MAFVQVPGDGLWIPRPMDLLATPAFSTSSVIDATGEKVAFCGRVWNKDRATKSIRRVGFLFGTCNNGGAGTLTVSLQDVHTTAGQPIQPDETQDQTVTVPSADIVSDTWYRTGTLSADRSVAFGEQLAVVIELTAARVAPDSIVLKQITLPAASSSSACVVKTGGSWAVVGGRPNCVLEFTDGTFGTLDGGSFIVSAMANPSVNLNSASIDEYGQEFQVPFPCKVDGAQVFVTQSSAVPDVEMILYSGTTPMTGGTVTLLANQATRTTGSMLYAPFSQEIELSANTAYILAIRPLTGTNISQFYFDVADANHFQCHGMGAVGGVRTRLNQGAWSSATTTRRLYFSIRVSSLDDGVPSLHRRTVQAIGL